MKKTQFFALTTVAILLSACGDPQTSCSDYGFERGTAAYAICLQNEVEKNRRSAQRLACASNSLRQNPDPNIRC